ncbi:MAG: chemotaxis-specific protein-glutamate methyltransferase CheB [Candidatus Lokiarchaeota archaeon]|nr:chemotaxis-specific protein-glutamate methyltransferase CheB [Candidatus Lokiarchaeota archaeon]
MVIKVLLAEDSAFQRKIISEMLQSHEEIEIVATARNGKEAIKKVGKYNPDVLILDLVMPEMDGLEAFEFLSEHYPIPTIIFSSLDPTSLDFTVQALLLGAVDYLQKPKGKWDEELPKYREQLIEKIFIASKINKNYQMRREAFIELINKHDAIQDKLVIIPESLVEKLKSPETYEIPLIERPVVKNRVVVIGASVGGPKTLKSVLSSVPKDFPLPILIVQHMNKDFMEQFSDSLDKICSLKVKIPENGEIIKGNTVYLAPGGMHMEVILTGNKPTLRTFIGAPVNFCIPAVDVLFKSAAKIYGQNTLGVLLTGMGADGVEGLLKIKNFGGKTIAEAKETCILYGMPKIAADRGAADWIIPNYQVIDYMRRFSSI